MKYKILILVFVLFLVGCSQINKEIEKVKKEWNISDNKTEEISDETIPGNCPQISCPKLEGENLDRIVYIFDNIPSSMREFISSTDETELSCQFTVLNNQLIAESLIDTSKRANVKIILDKSNTMDYCDVSCIPKLESQYNKIYSEGLNIKMIDNIHYSYCINQNGVFITSKSFNDAEFNDYGLYIKSEGLKESFNNEFNRIFG